MSTKLSTPAIKLLVSNSFLRWSRVLVQIFLSVYVWEQTWDLRVIALFNIILHLFHLLGFVTAAFFVKLWYRNIVNSVAFSIAIILFWSLIFLSNYLIEYVYVVAAVIGLYVGVYYVNYDVNQFDLSHFKNRWNLEWIKKSLKISIKIFFPILYWFIISYYSFSLAFAFSLLLLLAWFYYGRIDFKPSVWKLQISRFIELLKDNKRLVFTLLGSFFLTVSFSATVVEALISLIIFDKVWWELELGVSLSVVSLISIVIVYAFWKFVDYKKYNMWLVIFNITYILLLLLFLRVLDSYNAIIVISWLVTAIILLYQVIASVLNSNSLHSIKNLDNYKVEFYIFRETAYIAWWTLWFVIVYLVWDLSYWSLQTIFYVLMWFSIITTSLLMRVNIHELDN